MQYWGDLEQLLVLIDYGVIAQCVYFINHLNIYPKSRNTLNYAWPLVSLFCL